MNESAPRSSSPLTYTPGYARCKLAMLLFGLLLMILGLTQLALPLRLVLFGARAQAEATQVVKIKEGFPPVVLRSDEQIDGQLEPRDRSYTFWNEFHFRTEQGRDIDVRAPVGSKLKPLYTLLDEDGLPTSDLVVYDRDHPETVVFPLIVSTWFAPGMLFLIGMLCSLVASVLLYWANRPIELPDLPSREES